eukprot:CAMPEP_0170794808 /NCGR_PEP_ID=MMETSP0733-20121128/23657_1 /TAXON_ID=186038 /ORGANISM="Fragilariopsis kerguelensis, Strain L26-C5" /LENGTH=109 /DNA_ID=CAMNT_0011144393 /DNA_START=196 /DNA_END=525 /DNA_ORIENTATION=-
MTKRIAFKMKLKAGQAQEYKKRHDEIWPQLKEIISTSGVYDYSIFLDEETNILFATQKINEDNYTGVSSQDLGINPVVQKWWAYMADIMECNDDKSPVTIPLKEVFHLP